MAETQLAGQQLASARKEKGLSQEEVAAELRLSVTYVKAIEADDYERLPEATFVRGYVRNYARLLELPENEAREIVALFDQQNKHKEADFKGARPLSTFPTKRRSWWPLIFLLVLILIAIQGVLMWKKPYSAQDDTLPKAETRSSSLLEAEQEERIVEVEEKLVAAKPDAEVGEQGAELDDANAIADVDDALVVEDEAADLSAAVVDEELEADAEEEVEATEEATSEALRINFTAECWVSVKTDSGKTLYTGTKQPGETLTLDESGPYHFVFGNGAAVQEMFVSGQQQELPARRSGQVWRYTIK